MTHAERVAALLSLIRQGNAEEIALLLDVAQSLRARRGMPTTAATRDDLVGHALALLLALEGQAQ